MYNPCIYTWPHDLSFLLLIIPISSPFVGTMARHFGSLGCKVRGIISYTLSPYELKAYAGAFSKGVPNMMFRIQSQLFRVVPRMYRSLWNIILRISICVYP